MKQTQKIIKYLALAFGIFLSVNIIIAIVSGIIFGTQTLTGFKLEENETLINKIIAYNQSDKIEKIQIDLGISELNIKKGDEFRVETINTNEDFSCELKNDILKIKDQKNWNIYQENKTSTINIYIPESREFIETKIKKGVRRY